MDALFECNIVSNATPPEAGLVTDVQPMHERASNWLGRDAAQCWIDAMGYGNPSVAPRNTQVTK